VMAAPIFNFLADALFWFAFGPFSGALLALGMRLAYAAGRNDGWRGCCESAEENRSAL